MKNGLVGILVEANKWMYIQAKGVYNELASPWGNQHGNEHANMKTTFIMVWREIQGIVAAWNMAI